jgi:DNA-binding transcriptional LysR family regulator
VERYVDIESMELRQLSYFKAVAEELHFGRAAARVRIAQPALSNHVMALERELGCALFIRSTRRVELTRAGETFYDRCVRILSEVDLTTELTRAAGGSRIRRVDSPIPIKTMVMDTAAADTDHGDPGLQLNDVSGRSHRQSPMNCYLSLSVMSGSAQAPALSVQRRNIALALTPPKPKPLEIAKSISNGRASFATKSIPSAAGSGAFRFKVGGAT